MFLCRHQSGGRQRRSRETLPSPAEGGPAGPALSEDPQLGVLRQTSECTFLHPSVHTGAAPFPVPRTHRPRVKSRLGL